MTVASTLNKVTIAGNGATTSFPFNFAMPGVPVSQAAAFLVVTVVSASGVSTVIPFGPASSQYQLSLNPVVSPSPTPVGGIVTYNPLGVPLPTGSTLTIQRILPETQLSSFSGQGTLWPTVVESTLDYITMISQQLQSLFGNFFQAPQTDPLGLNYTTPAAAQRANQALGFDGSGNLTTFTVLPAGTVSSAMAPVVNAATLAAGRTAFGLGTMATEGIGAALQDDGIGNVRVVFAVNKLNISTAITSANFLQKIKGTGPITLTLPRANTLWPGFGFWLEVLQASTGPVTLTPNAADQIEGVGSGVSVTVQQGDSIFISTDGATNAIWYIELAHGTTVNPTPSGFASGVAIDVTSGIIGTNTATATASSVSVSDGTNFFTVVPTGGINFGTVGAGGIDTGAIAAAKFYNVWVIYNPASQVANWIVSLQSTFAGLKPNLPPNFTAAGLVGVLPTAPAVAALMGTRQRGNRVEYIVGLGQTSAMPAAATGSAGSTSIPTWVSTSLASIVPPNAKSYNVVLRYGTTGGSADMMAAPSNSYGAISSTTNPPPLSLSGFQTGGAGINSNSMVSATGTFLGSGPVFYASSSGQAGTGLFIDGFELNL